MSFPNLHREAWFLLVTVAIVLCFVAGFVVWPFVPLSSLAVAAAVIRGALVMLTFSAAWVVPMPMPQRGGLMGASVGMFLSTQSLLNPETPWEAWATIIAGSGWLVYMGSKFGPKVWDRIARIAGDE